VTILEAFYILENATSDCKKRNIDTSEVREALDLLKGVVQPHWLIPQYRNNIKPSRENDGGLEGQQQTLRATMNAIRRSMLQLVGERMDRVARKFAASHDPKLKEELGRLSAERAKLRDQ